MIHDSLLFLAEKLDSYVKDATGNPSADKMVILTNISNGSGIAIPDSTIGLSLVNIEEEKVFKEQRTKYRNEDGNYELRNPELKLNLYILICANHMDGDTQIGSRENYYEGLKRLSHVIAFFQANSVFTLEEFPDLPNTEPGGQLEKLVVELYSYSFEQMYNFWSVLGGNYLPSVLYKVRLITIKDTKEKDSELPITKIGFDLNQR